MLFLKKLFNISNSEDLSNSQPDDLPKESLDAVLLQMANKVLREEMANYPILKENGKKVSQLFEKGYLRISTVEENLKREFLLPELKEILRDNDLKVSGKKDDLIDRIVSNINPNNLKSPKSKLERILLTANGKEFVFLENERFNKEKDSTKN
ncbi:SAP domain-containing protein [Algoriphagus sp. H41]|uniref:SAP domain-containing protein n=1 Tax=Algoriphagus oliviformis TaxID=2811231 RepID=A0ABS3BWZ7_9BACT|nr:SAP domain-containing protein [Algoriphagus oliviformis]MBN7809393.1 SAP domain-containing protein [Algoriphagus oliviformis]